MDRPTVTCDKCKTKIAYDFMTTGNAPTEFLQLQAGIRVRGYAVGHVPTATVVRIGRGKLAKGFAIICQKCREAE